MFVGLLIYVCWFLFFCIRAYIANSLNKFPNYIEKKVKTDIVIEDLLRIRNQIYHKTLIKLKFETTDEEVYYGKYICDPLYFNTYLKSQLCRKLDVDISVWHNKNNERYFIDVPSVMRDIAGVERRNYVTDLLKGQSTKVNPILVILLILLLINMLLVIINFVDYNFKNVLLLVCIFGVIVFAFYLTAKK